MNPSKSLFVERSIMSSLFSKEFLHHVSTELGCEESQLIEVMDGFLVPKEIIAKPLPPVENKVVVKTPVKKEVVIKTPPIVNEKHTCERIPRGKKDACGKRAKNFIEDGEEKHWYCGTEKSGCYKTVTGAKAKVSAKAVTSTPNHKPKKTNIPTTNRGRKEASDSKSASLIHKIVKQKKLEIKSVKSKGKTYWINLENRILFDRYTKEAYGVLDGDMETILPLQDSDVRWLEAHGVSIRKEEVDESVSSDNDIEVGEESDSGDNIAVSDSDEQSN